MASCTKKFNTAKRVLDINNMPSYDTTSLLSPSVDCRRFRLRKRAREQETVPCTCQEFLLATDVYKLQDGKYDKGIILKFKNDEWLAEVDFENATVDTVNLASPQVRVALSSCLKKATIPTDDEIRHEISVEDDAQTIPGCPQLPRRTPSPDPFVIDEIALFQLPPSIKETSAGKANRKGHIYTPDEEAFLINCVETHGKRWKTITDIFAKEYKHIHPSLSLVQLRSKYCRMVSTHTDTAIAQNIYNAIVEHESSKRQKWLKMHITHRSSDESDAINALLNIQHELP